ncbi:MAG: Holliday junction branch migration DNA helicase RuvB [Vampirovibrio sp.]|nr:Holliday junction branch migration DNA helicase RuvB [Vampirovibrio sp.]
MAVKYSGKSADSRIDPQQPAPKSPTAGSKILKSPTDVRPGLLKQQETDDDRRLDNTIRPHTFQEYIGQQALRESLDISLKAAQNRGEPLDHLLLYGPPGLGKTTLAMVMAREMNTDIQITAAPALERPRDIIGILMSLQPGSVLFIDEIHRLNKVTEEILYPALEDFTLDRTIGKGQSAKILRVPLPRFTLIGATTKAGAISSPLRDRFGMVCRLNFYTEVELMRIIHRSAGILKVNIEDLAARTIASRSRGTPRIANRLLRRVRDYCQVKHADQKMILQALAEEALDLFDIDPAGLDPTDRLLLKTMIHNFNGGPVGLDTLAAAIGEDPRTLEDVYEPYLLQSGLLHRTPRGRMVTPMALQHLKIDVGNVSLAVQQALPTFTD